MMFPCPRCGAVATSISRMLHHLAKVHSNEPRFHVVCSLPKSTGVCCSTFRTVASFRTHICRFHADVMMSKSFASTTSSVITEVKCCTCGVTVLSLRALSEHYKEHCKEGVSVACLVKHCNKSFSVYSSYTAHMSRCHRNVSLINLRDDVKHCRSVEVPVIDGQNHDESESFSDDVVLEEANEVNNITRNIALMLLKLKAQCCLADRTVQAIVGDFSDICDVSTFLVKQHIKTLCDRYSLPASAVSDFCEAADTGSWKTAMTELSSEWKRNAYYRKAFPYVPPCEYKFDDDCRQTAAFQYVSLIDSLKILLQNEEVRTQILNPEVSCEGHLKSFRDGTLYKEHSVFSQTEHGLEIIVYSDEFEVVNPLGPHKKKHKMMAFYYTLGNLQNRSRARKSSMLLLALCKSIHVQKYGFDRIAQRVNDELSVLETDGIVVSGYAYTLRGALAYIAGDNLNSHLIGGYNASFSPNVSYPCRFCLTSNTHLQQIETVDETQLRTRHNYDQHVNQLDESQSSVFGIRYKSCFNSGCFHVADGLPPDIMHDLLEGVVPYETALVLKFCLSKGYFSLVELNSIISGWNYGPLDKADKPVAISAGFGDTIKQNAGRMWCFLRLFPLMVGKKVPETDIHWKFLLELKEIVELTFAPRLALGHVLMLQTKIQDHIQSFRELFPEKLLKPKQHFMLHYGRCLLTFGPLRMCWCMRFEAKHYFFCRLMRIINNYKNACKTLAERHQMQLSYLLASDSLFTEHDAYMSSTTDVDVNYLADCVVNLLVAHKVQLSQPLHQCKFVNVNGVMYRCAMYVVVSVVDDVPALGRIDAIYMQNMKCLLLLRVCLSQYDSHFGAYKVCATNTIAVHEPDELLDYYPLSGYVVDLDRYVVLKNFIYSHSLYD